MPWVNQEMCTGCGTCLESCPVDAISIQDNERALIDEEECIRCGVCHDVCPEEAVRHDSERIPELVEANMAWVEKLRGKFETEKEKKEVLERLVRHFDMQLKVVQKTQERLQALQ